MNRKEIIDVITPVIENTAMRHGLIPLEVTFEKENDHWFLRIYIYSTEHPVNHEDCTHITRGLGDLLDELIPFKYYLEVSSPGVERKLKTEREYQLFKGKKVKVKLKEPINKEHYLVGILGEYQKGIGLKIITESPEEEHLIKIENLASIRLQGE